MKRISNLYNHICSLENLRLADQLASKGKGRQIGVKEHMANQETNIEILHTMLIERTFKTAQYKTFIIFEPKRREIFRLPYFPDRIVHHAIMNVLEPVWVPMFTSDTYSCIKGRGVHSAGRSVKEALKNESETRYCLKLDVQKFYPSIDHDILKHIIRKKIKDTDLLQLLDNIIDSADGLPIGNYLSQYLANVYLTYFDHWLKEVVGVKHYFRYCDDMVILSANKTDLHRILGLIRSYLKDQLRLTIKGNYQIFPVEKRGIDFVGYKFFHTHTLLRKSIKQNYARAVAKRKGQSSIAAYEGWAKHANTLHLVKKLRNESNTQLPGFRDKVRI
jgi:RNA-directed DNA polymerase